MGRLRHAYIFPILSLLPALSSAITLDCKNLKADEKTWNLGFLEGKYSIYHVEESDPSTHNTTYTLDICKPLKSSGCKQGTYVCGEEWVISDGKSMLSDYINIAGNYFFRDARPLDPEIQRLKSIDEEREGVRLTLHGGKHPFDEKKDDKKGETQQAQVDFVCDSERTGLEGLEGGEEKLKVERWPESNKQYGTADDDKDDNDDKDDKGDKDDGSDDPKSLRFISYGHQDGTKSQVLKLEWRTKYACEDFEDDNGGDRSGNHWGFFTWLIVLFFLGAAAYLIFGSWLNYNRHGARGWDMLPHGDTIRDIPYLLKDWARKVVSTIQGPGSRGGYSAV